MDTYLARRSTTCDNDGNCNQSAATTIIVVVIILVILKILFWIAFCAYLQRRRRRRRGVQVPYNGGYGRNVGYSNAGGYGQDAPLVNIPPPDISTADTPALPEYSYYAGRESASKGEYGPVNAV